MRYILPAITAIGFTAVLATGCKKVDSNDLKDTVPYYQEYTVTYDKAANQTKATALIRVREANGARVDLTNGAYIRANGVDENNKQLTSNTYNWKFSGSNDVAFELKKNSGDVFQNTISLTDVGTIDFPSNLPVTVSKAAGFTFNWAGTALGSGEKLSASVRGTNATNVALPLTVPVKVEGGQIVVTPEHLSVLAAGELDIILEREKDMQLDKADGTAAGTMQATVITEKKIILSE
jgi:hypothetical protein